MELRTALANIHRDPVWWRKVLLGGALALTVVGAPWPAGLVVESFDNARKGFPTPLPPLRGGSTRYTIGLLALLIDIVFFVLPLLAIGLLFVCGALLLMLSTSATAGGPLLSVLALFLLAYEAVMFAMSVSPVARLLYARDGRIEEALGAEVLRRATNPLVRAEYLRARIRSLPAYLPALALGAACWLVLRSDLPGALSVAALLLWLALSALCYAHLVVAQLYAAVALAVGE